MRHNRAGEQRSFNLFGLFSIVAAIFFTPLCAYESFKDFKKSQTQSFAEYKDENDRLFSGYLKQEWEAYSSQQVFYMYEKQKPLEIEKARNSSIKVVGPKIRIDIPKDVNISDTLPIGQSQQRQKEISFDFFGTKLGFDVPKQLRSATFYPQSKNGISAFFNIAAMSDYEDLLSEIKKISTEMNLNDWGVYLLVSRISTSVYNNSDDSRLFVWFVLNKLGYAVKAALADKRVVLMHYSQKTIFGSASFLMEGRRYYVLHSYAEDDMGRVFTYPHDYPEALKELDLSLETLPRLAYDVKEKSLAFTYGDKSYEVPISYNKNLIEFMATYPQADYDIYFNAPIDPLTYGGLAFWFKTHIEGKKASEAMNFVLGFVQKSFKYEPDKVHFSKEKVMFADETLYYDKSDCEDRAVLFARLMRALFGVSVVGVKYKDHMATALYIPMDGKKVNVGKKEFVIADPTYVNAPIGTGIPKYGSIVPERYIMMK